MVSRQTSSTVFCVFSENIQLGFVKKVGSDIRSLIGIHSRCVNSKGEDFFYFHVCIPPETCGHPLQQVPLCAVICSFNVKLQQSLAVVLSELGYENPAC